MDEDGFWFLHGRYDDTLNIAGKRIGLVTTATVYDATPAAFSINAKSRRDSQALVSLYLALEPDVLMGGGADYFLPAGTGGGNGSITIGSTTVTSPNNVNLPASGIGGFDASSIGLTLVNDSLTALLNLEISALEQEGRGKIISSPRVITADKINRYMT